MAEKGSWLGIPFILGPRYTGVHRIYSTMPSNLPAWDHNLSSASSNKQWPRITASVTSRTTSFLFKFRFCSTTPSWTEDPVGGLSNTAARICTPDGLSASNGVSIYSQWRCPQVLYRCLWVKQTVGVRFRRLTRLPVACGPEFVQPLQTLRYITLRRDFSSLFFGQLRRP